MKIESVNYSRLCMSIFIMAMICMMAISYKFYGAPIQYIFLFCMYLILYIQIPGRLLLKIVKAEYGSILADSLISFFCGCFILFFEYYLFSFFNISWMISKRTITGCL